MNASSESATGKNLVLSALRHQPVTKTPWIPFAGVHAGKLKGYTARQVLTDKEKLIESLLEVNKIYAPDGQPVLFDLQLEAEILGCELVWAENAPPSVASHPLETKMEIPTVTLDGSMGRLPLVLDVMREMKARVGDKTALFGLITGPMTLASHLRGTEIFMDTFDNPEFLKELLAYCEKVSLSMVDMYLKAGMDVIAVVDPVVSQVSPRMFSQYLHTPFKAVFDHIRAQGALSAFFVCGDATKNIEVMCKTGPDSIFVDENIDLVKVKPITDQYRIVIGGNIPLTTRMLLGNQQDNMQFVVELLEALGGAETLKPENFVLAPGCDMPYDTPIENVVAVGQTVRDPHTVRHMVENYHSSSFDVPVDLPDYAALTKPLVEVFTLDSDTCAACSYMMFAARRAEEELGDRMDLVEYKYNTPENVSRLRKMGVKNLPSLYINGKLAFSSLIPNHRELLDAIDQAK